MFQLRSRGYQLRQGAAGVVLAAIALSGAHHAACAAGKPKVHAVTIEAMRFSPETIEAAPGDTVIWTNKDPFPHTVTAGTRAFDSGEIAANRSWKLKVRRKGDFPYVCTLHPSMKGKLIVK